MCATIQIVFEHFHIVWAMLDNEVTKIEILKGVSKIIVMCCHGHLYKLEKCEKLEAIFTGAIPRRPIIAEHKAHTIRFPTLPYLLPCPHVYPMLLFLFPKYIFYSNHFDLN